MPCTIKKLFQHWLTCQDTALGKNIFEGRCILSCRSCNEDMKWSQAIYDLKLKKFEINNNYFEIHSFKLFCLSSFSMPTLHCTVLCYASFQALWIPEFHFMWILWKRTANYGPISHCNCCAVPFSGFPGNSWYANAWIVYHNHQIHIKAVREQFSWATQTKIVLIISSHTNRGVLKMTVDNWVWKHHSFVMFSM